jgi:uroporphyrinogen decarboxylase
MTTAMDPRTRVRTALDHREPDRVPRDLGGTRFTSIHERAYRRLRPALGLPEREPVVIDISQQLARVEDDVVESLGADVKGIAPRSPSTWRREMTVDEDCERFVDEWGVVRARPRDGGLYFEVSSAPLAGDIDESGVRAFAWPDPADAARYAGMAEEAAAIAQGEHRAVYVGSICAGVTEIFLRLRGYEDGYLDLAARPTFAQGIMERVVDLKLAYWERALAALGDDVDVVGEADDLGGQNSLLFSPATYRTLVKPLHRRLFEGIRARTRAKVFLHSCGAIRELIPDLIEIGVDILNPVQVSAAGMDTAGLKRDFGADVTFWGGAVDTQRTLATGSPAEVRSEVARRIGDLAPGGGFVFASVHNIQANVPTANMVALWETVQEVGSYA